MDIQYVGALTSRAMAWVVLALLGVTLGVGMSWAHIRRRASGQASVDRVDN